MLSTSARHNRYDLRISDKPQICVQRKARPQRPAPSRAQVSEKQRTILRIPRSLDISVWQATLKPLELEKLLYLVSYVCLRNTCGKHHRQEDEFIAMNSRRMREVVGNSYTRLIAILVDEGVFEEDFVYIPNSKSRGYRLAPQYNGSTRDLPVENETLRARIAARRNRPEHETHVTKQFYDKVKLIEIVLEDALNEIVLQEQKDAKEHGAEKAAKLRECYYRQVLDIYEGRWRMFQDFTGRIHTNITSLWTPLRKHLRYKGQRFVNVDIKNSQPFILAATLKDWATREISEAEISDIALQMLYLTTHGKNHLSLQEERGRDPWRNTEHTTLTLHEEYKNMLRRSIRKAKGALEEIERFLASCTGKGFYEELGDLAEAAGKPELNEILRTARGVAKRRLLRTLYENPHKSYADEYEEYWQAAYPAVKGICDDIKDLHYQLLPKYMQHVEAKAILKPLEGKLGQFEAIATIHDSLLVLEKDAAVAQHHLEVAFQEKPIVNVGEAISQVTKRGNLAQVATNVTMASRHQGTYAKATYSGPHPHAYAPHYLINDLISSLFSSRVYAQRPAGRNVFFLPLVLLNPPKLE